MSVLSFDLQVPLDRFDLQVAWRGESRALGLFGPSGSGKTTLLETLAGLRPRARGRLEVAGRVWIDTERGVHLPPEARDVGYVPQDLLLFPHLDVTGNLSAGRARAARREWQVPLERVVETLELQDLARRRVDSLSGGEKRRVALGRALCSGPGLLLLDEPLAGLDAPLRRRVVSLLLRVQERFEVPTIYVSHDLLEMRLLCSEVAVLRRGELAARGDPESLARDPSVWPEASGGHFENLLRGEVEGISGGVARVAAGPAIHVAAPAGDLAAGSRVVVGVPASAIILAARPPEGLSAQNVFHGVVVSTRASQAEEDHGDVDVEVKPDGSDRTLLACLTQGAAARMGLVQGSSVHAIFKVHACRVLASW